MKTTTSALLLSSTLLVFAACSPDSKKQTIVGQWEGESHGQKQTVIYNEDGSWTKIKGNDVKMSSDIDDTTKTLKYEVDYSKTPHAIDYVIFDKSNNEEVARLKGIFEFLSDKTMRFYMEEAKYNVEKALVRPKEFDESKTIVLTRVQ